MPGHGASDNMHHYQDGSFSAVDYQGSSFSTTRSKMKEQLNNEDIGDLQHAFNPKPISGREKLRQRSRRSHQKQSQPPQENLSDEEHPQSQIQRPEIEDYEVGKYEKKGLIEDIRKEREFVYQDLSRLKIYALAVIFLSALILVCSFLVVKIYKLQNITSFFFNTSILIMFLISIFGQISIVRVEQTLHKYYYSNLSGTFSFEALMVYFRITMVFVPVMVFNAVQLIFNVDQFVA